jgi:hypothetical protein
VKRREEKRSEEIKITKANEGEKAKQDQAEVKLAAGATREASVGNSTVNQNLGKLQAPCSGAIIETPVRLVAHGGLLLAEFHCSSPWHRSIPWFGLQALPDRIIWTALSN